MHKFQCMSVLQTSWWHFVHFSGFSEVREVMTRYSIARIIWPSLIRTPRIICTVISDTTLPSWQPMLNYPFNSYPDFMQSCLIQTFTQIALHWQPMLNCPFNSNPDFVVLYNFFSVQFCTFMLKFHPNMTHLTLPWPTIKFSLDQGLFCGATDCPCFRLCDPPHGFQSQSGSVTCLYAVNLRVKSGAMVSTWTGKLGKMRKIFPVREFWTDWKSQGILPKMLEKWGNFSQFLS